MSVPQNYVEYRVRGNRGFIMIYTAFIIVVMLGAVTAIVRNTRTESGISTQGLASTQAQLAAEAGVECVKYWQLASGVFAFSPNNGTARTIKCGYAANENTATVGGECGGNYCLCSSDIDAPPKVYATFQIGPNDGPCAKVTVTVTQTIANGTGACDFAVQSRGLDHCSNPTVERVRWEVY